VTDPILKGEILEQPQVVSRLLETEREHVRALADRLRGGFDYIIIAARGTSDNAARYGKYLLGARNQIQVALATPSLFTMYQRSPNFDHALVMGISQSGQSPDVISVVREARDQGRPTLAITNDPKSPLADEAEHTICLQAGEERAVAATKTYTASLVALALLASCLADRGTDLDELVRLPDQMRVTLDQLFPLMEDRAERYRYMEHCAVIGRGYNYATAFEIALKIKELTQIVAEPYSSADFRHGPIRMVGDGFPIILIAPGGAVFGDIRNLVKDLVELRSERLIISEVAEALGQAHFPLPLPQGTPEWLSPVLSVLPGQLLGLYLALARGLDPDHPEGLQKVTETW
jgi:glucosamine--fructose-6-phosphate aminotransferase (isomerizing)